MKNTLPNLRGSVCNRTPLHSWACSHSRDSRRSCHNNLRTHSICPTPQHLDDRVGRDSEARELPHPERQIMCKLVGQGRCCRGRRERYRSSTISSGRRSGRGEVRALRTKTMASWAHRHGFSEHPNMARGPTCCSRVGRGKPEGKIGRRGMTAAWLGRQHRVSSLRVAAPPTSTLTAAAAAVWSA